VTGALPPAHPGNTPFAALGWAGLWPNQALFWLEWGAATRIKTDAGTGTRHSNEPKRRRLPYITKPTQNRQNS